MTPSRIERGSVWLADLDPVARGEQGGTRPVLVVSAESFNRWPVGLVTVVPITTKNRGFAHHVPVRDGGLDRLSYAMPEYMRSISQRRLKRQLGQASASTTMAEVDAWLRRVLDLPAD